MTSTEAFEQGRQAFIDGKDIEANPYLDGDLNRADRWELGWAQAQVEKLAEAS